MPKKDTNKGIRTKAAEATELLDTIKGINNQINSIYTEIENNKNNVIETVETIKTNKKNSESQVTLIEEKLKELDSLFNKIDEKANKIDDTIKEFVQPIIDIYDQEENPTTKAKELNAILNDSKQKEQNITSIFTQLQEIKTKYNQILSEYNKYNKELTELKQKIDNEDTGIDAILLEVETINKNCKQYYSQISEYETKTKSLLEKANEEQKNIQSIKKNINDERDNIHKIHEELNEIYSIAANKAQGGIFNTHRRINFWQKWFWVIVTVLTYIGWGYAILNYGFNNANDSLFLENVIKVIAISIPFAFLLLLLTKNVQNAQKAEERYAFKSVLAFSLRQEVHELTLRYPESSDEILNFTIDQLGRLYSVPYELKNGINKIDILKELKEQIEKENEENVDLDNKKKEEE